MPAPLSLDIRLRFQRLIEAGHSGRSAARQLLLSPATGSRLAGKVRRGESVAPSRCGRPAGVGKLTRHEAFLVELVEQDPDITLPELRDALEMAEGVTVHTTSISRVLRHLGFTYKKNRWRRTSGGAPTSPAPGASG